MQSRGRCHCEDQRGRRERLRRRGGIGRRTGAGNSNSAVWVGLGSKASSLHVRGTSIPILKARYFCRPPPLHHPGEGGTHDAGGRLHQQGNRRSSRDRGAHGESTCSQTHAKGWYAESRHALGTCDYAFAGCAQKQLTKAALKPDCGSAKPRRRSKTMTYVMTKPCAICKKQLIKRQPTEAVPCCCGKHVWQG